MSAAVDHGMLPDLEYVRPHLYPKQLAAIFEPKRISLIEASTKAGKTSACITWIVELALQGLPGQNFWWVAPINDQAMIAFRRAMRSIPHDLYTANLSLKTITLVGGSVIWFKSAEKPNGLYGEDVYGVVADEASRMKEDAWFAIRSTVTYTRAPMRIIGNVKGRKNWFFRMARRAEHGDPEMAFHKINAYDAVEAGVLDAKEIEDAKSQLPEQVFRELYLAEPSDDGGNPFGMTHVRGCVVPELSKGPPASWGWDLAKRMDYTVGIALDAAGYVCRFERFHGKPWDLIIEDIIRMTGRTPALVDSTGVGDPVVDLLQKRVPGVFEGYHFTSQSKQKLMEGLAVAIQRRNITYPDGVIVQELEQFEFVATRTGVRYSAPEGYHDDCVCALALAVQNKSQVRPQLNISPEMVQQVLMAPRRRG